MFPPVCIAMRVVREATPGSIDPHPPEDLHQPGGSFRLTLDRGLDQAGFMVVVGVVPAEHQPAVELARLVKPIPSRYGGCPGRSPQGAPRRSPRPPPCPVLSAS